MNQFPKQKIKVKNVLLSKKALKNLQNIKANLNNAYVLASIH